jgi:uncharacterized protein (TIGR00661 family)
MTQAIALYEMLNRHGHQVVRVLTGKSDRREVPAYFLERIACPVEKIESPNFITDSSNKRIKVIPSIFHNLKFSEKYFGSLARIKEVINQEKPDVLINFYDILGGLFAMRYQTGTKIVNVGHQFLATHPEFSFASGTLDRQLFNLNNLAVGIGSVKKLALSFRPYHPMKFKDIVVVPPLLRNEIFDLNPVTEDFILAYMVNDGYGDDLMKWHESNRGVKIHCFWDRKNMPDVYSAHPNLTFHQLNGPKFLHYMNRCKGLVSTAGFESVCEAMYLGKPVLMIPVEGQYEQQCNAIDAINSGAGISAQSFQIDKMVDYLPDFQPVRNQFSSWLAQAEDIFLRELTNF